MGKSDFLGFDRVQMIVLVSLRNFHNLKLFEEFIALWSDQESELLLVLRQNLLLIEKRHVHCLLFQHTY